MLAVLDDAKIDDIIYAHSLWKLRLKQAISAGNSEFDVDTVRDFHICVFGQFLDSAEAKQLPNYQVINTLHQAFHAEAADILQLALNGLTQQAQQRMQSGSEFMQLTTQLVNHLADMKYQRL